jgi:ankyrin repeat protein
VWLLLEHEAGVEAKDKERGETALIFAAGSGHEAVVRLLLERGADVEATLLLQRSLRRVQPPFSRRP